MTLLPRPLLSQFSRTPRPPSLLSSSLSRTSKPLSNFDGVSGFSPRALKFLVSMSASSRPDVSSPLIHSHIAVDSEVSDNSPNKLAALEESLEKVVYGGRFFTFMAVLGSLTGSLLCYVKGCTYVVHSFMEYFAHRSKVILLLIEAIVMLVFGMGLYELFISNLDSVNSQIKDEAPSYSSSLLGMFILKARPKWLDVTTVNELKTKIGHVIVMLLLIGLLEKSMLAAIKSPLDLLCFSTCIFLSSGSLLLLSKLKV